MAKKITAKTRLRVGQVVYFAGVDGPVVQQIARLEDTEREDGNVCVALNKSPDHKEFEEENGVDLYTRIYKFDLVARDAEIINVLELICKLEHMICQNRKLRLDLALVKLHDTTGALKATVKSDKKKSKFPCRVKR